MNRALRGLLLYGLLTSGLQAAGVYKWVDENGVVHYADRPATEQSQRIDRRYIESRRIDPVPMSSAPPSFRARVERECALRRERLEAHHSAREIYADDAAGRRHRLPSEERSEMEARLAEAAQTFCASGAADRLWAAETPPDFLSGPTR